MKSLRMAKRNWKKLEFKVEKRLLGICLGMGLILGGFFYLLYKIQIVDGAGYLSRTQSTVSRRVVENAVRGRLTDRNGKVLVESETSYRVTVEEALSDAESLLTLRQLCGEYGVEYGQELSTEDSVFVTRLRELELPGVTVQAVGKRVYRTDCAAHILGRIGPIYAEKWEEYEEKGYHMDDEVGIDGAEWAFEEELHGTNGVLLLQEDGEGGLLSQSYAVQPSPGNNVSLTLDLNLQQVAEEGMADLVASLEGARGGACVVLDIGDGGVLASASYPTYQLSSFRENYSQLAADPLSPLFNRAFQGTYAPGSTFKPVTAAAGLEEGIITPETEILDTGKYTYYSDYQPQCWLYRQEGRTHGYETVAEALRDSCNVFFYDVGRRLGINRLDEYARALGLGEATGVELTEASGTLAGADSETVWYAGNTLAAAIGQSSNLFTPLQLASCLSSLLRGGVRYQVHLLKEVTSYDGSQLLRQAEPQVLSQIPLSRETVDTIKKGMAMVAEQGSVGEAFSTLGVKVGAKTGSAQVTGQEHSNAVFVCFAPYENPEVAIAIVVENGGSGSEAAGLAAQVLAAYFD